MNMMMMTFDPVCVCVCVQAEQQLQKKSKGQPGEMLEKAAEQLMSCFRVCASDKSVHTHTHTSIYTSVIDLV